MRNKKGNVFLNLGIGIVLFISGVLFSPFLTDDIATARTNLGCSDFSTISDGTMLVCIGISGVAPYFIWFFLSIGLGFLIGGLKNG